MKNYCHKCMNPLEEYDSECPFCGNDFSEEIPSHHLIPGTLLKNRFYIGLAIGEGGFGITYIGKDTVLGTKVAIKEYYPNSLVNRSNTVSPTVHTSSTEERKNFFTKGKQRFLKEAQTLAKFDNYPGIVTVKDFFEENNTAYIVMEYLDGITLKDHLKTNGNLSYEQTINIIKPIMESLDKIHNAGLIHRDISPDNIMIADDRVKLIDFGAARVFSGNENSSVSVMLKHGYAPEEQYRTKGNQGPWTDIYALCATIYKCITGITPDDANERVRNDELKAPSELGIDIPVKAELALLKGLSVLQENRYKRITDLIYGLVGDHDSPVNKISISAAKSNLNSADNAEDTPTEYLDINNPKKTSDIDEDDKPTELIQPQKTDPIVSSDKNTKKKSSGNKGKIIALLIAVIVLVTTITVAFISKNNNQDPESGNSTISTSTTTTEMSVNSTSLVDESTKDSTVSLTETTSTTTTTVKEITLPKQNQVEIVCDEYDVPIKAKITLWGSFEKCANYKGVTAYKEYWEDVEFNDGSSDDILSSTTFNYDLNPNSKEDLYALYSVNGEPCDASPYLDTCSYTIQSDSVTITINFDDHMYYSGPVASGYISVAENTFVTSNNTGNESVYYRYSYEHPAYQ